MAGSSQAEVLKAEGNALFVQNDFSGAYKKYTAAIKLDNQNAILYCNRAACSFGLNRYLDACVDATKATELDPSYAKAWGRLAAAEMSLDRPEFSRDAWKRAVAALPNENLTPAQEKQRAQYTSELAAAEAKVADLTANPKPPPGMTTVKANDRSNVPWNRAYALLPDYSQRRVVVSSAWVIHYAHMSWDEAMNRMRQGHFTPGANGQRGYYGSTGVLEGLSNAIIADSRIFHITDQNFLEMYQNQVLFEAAKTEAWKDSGARGVIEAIPKRLREEGWNSVRPALSVTVRAWILRAFMEDGLKGEAGAALEFYTSALDVLLWGSKEWKDVPAETKGAIFSDTFIRGVNCLRLDMYMKAYDSTSTVSTSKYPLDELLAGANALLEEMKDAQEEPDSAEPLGFWWAFHKYPLGQAHALRGFCFHRKAMRLREANGLTDEVDQLYAQAAEEYLEAALVYPPDDENHVWFLHCSLHAQFDVAASARFMMFILDLMEKSIPLMRGIWEFSANASHWNGALEADMVMRRRLMTALEKEQIDMETIVTKATLGQNADASNERRS